MVISAVKYLSVFAVIALLVGLFAFRENKALAIYRMMKPYLLTFDIDRASVGLDAPSTEISAKNAEKLVAKIDAIIQTKQPLNLLLLAFPFKSGNQDRHGAGVLASEAERASLEYLHGLMIAIRGVYPNSTLTIVTDGLLFCDVFEIPERTVGLYEESLKKLSEDFPAIQIVTLQELLQKEELGLNAARDESANIVMPEGDRLVLNQRILNEIHHSRNSFSALSVHEKEVALAQTALKVLQRDQWVKDFMKRFERPNVLRLSFHYQKDFSQKVGIKLSASSVVAPWNMK